METKIKSKSEYLYNASWEDLYFSTEQWKSDIEFYRDETMFLRNLINKYFILLIEDGNIEKVQNISNKLSIAIKKKKNIYKLINKHLVHIEELIENAFSHDEKKFRDEHLNISDQISEFVKNFKMLKREIFILTEHVIENEKIKHLLTI
jgi:hypothetical protein